MTQLRSVLVGAALLLASIAAAIAQSNYPAPGGQTVPLYLQGCLNGSSQAVPCGAGAATTVGGSGATNTDAVANAATGAVPTETFNFLYNGTTWDRWRSINNAQAAGTGTGAVGIAPTSAASAGITAVVSAAAEATHILKASSGNLYSAYAVNLTATAGFLTIINATSAPGDGAQTPLACAPLPANGSASINFSPGPAQVYSTGITAIITSANTCFTKTTGAITGFISGSVQ